MHLRNLDAERQPEPPMSIDRQVRQIRACSVSLIVPEAIAPNMESTIPAGRTNPSSCMALLCMSVGFAVVFFHQDWIVTSKLPLTSLHAS